MPPNLGPSVSKSVTCSICQKKFSRTDHLKRHHLRHSGVKPYSCIFCDDSFTRSDNLRDHYLNCPHRKNRPIPEAARGGRRSHACDTARLCTSMKLGCDGTDYCNTCRYKGIECKYSKLQSKVAAWKQEDSVSKSGQENPVTSSSDRGSIRFLLNSGAASFIECFRFPPPTERRDIFNLRNELNDPRASNFFRNESEENNTYYEALAGREIPWLPFQDDNLARFLGSTITEVQMQDDDGFGPMFMDPDFAHTRPVSGSLLPGEWEPASVQSAAILQALLARSALLNLNNQEQADISQHLNYLFVPSKIEKFINCYFEFWHQHCPIIHKPSFSIETAHIPLLIAMTLMGAMHSQVDHEVSSAKVVLDLADLFIYSVDDFSDEFEIQQKLRFSSSSSPNQTSVMSMVALENLQAAYLMVCVQFWAGNATARRRAIETRFAAAIKVARRLRLTKARHGHHDSFEEHLWIRKESQIRLINTMTLLDCAFTFFSNFPHRLSVTEMKFDLVCEESLFASSHPFSEPTFKPSRHLTTYEAFKSLFCQEQPQAAEEKNKINPLGLSLVDMFTLIHLLYVYAHTQISFFSSFTLFSPHSSGASTPRSSTQESSSDPNITLIKTALSRWRILWIAIRANTPESVWGNLGLQRNGYNYWLVTQLLVNQKGSVDVMVGMEVNCEDTPKQLNGLLKDGAPDM